MKSGKIKILWFVLVALLCSCEDFLTTEAQSKLTEKTMYSTEGDMYRAVTEDKDLYASIDKDIDILEGQIRKAKTKKERMLKDSTLKVLEVQQAPHEVENEILKTEYYEIKPITPEDAKLKLQERPTQMFLTFVNVETGKTNVIHKLKDGKNYGLIEPEA